jgi:hypothetical protein
MVMLGSYKLCVCVCVCARHSSWTQIYNNRSHVQNQIVVYKGYFHYVILLILKQFFFLLKEICYFHSGTDNILI